MGIGEEKKFYPCCCNNWFRGCRIKGKSFRTGTANLGQNRVERIGGVKKPHLFTGVNKSVQQYPQQVIGTISSHDLFSSYTIYFCCRLSQATADRVWIQSQSFMIFRRFSDCRRYCRRWWIRIFIGIQLDYLAAARRLKTGSITSHFPDCRTDIGCSTHNNCAASLAK